MTRQQLKKEGWTQVSNLLYVARKDFEETRSSLLRELKQAGTELFQLTETSGKSNKEVVTIWRKTVNKIEDNRTKEHRTLTRIINSASLRKQA